MAGRQRQPWSMSSRDAQGGEYLHPMRAVLLCYGLREDVWTSKPSFFRFTSTGMRYDFLHDLEQC